MHLHRLLCAVLATAAGFPALRAQSSGQLPPRRLAIIAGINSATFGGGDVGDVSRRTGFMAGASMIAPTSPNVAIEPQILFTSKGAKFRDSGGGGSGSVTMNYIQVPFLVRLEGSGSSGMRPVIFGGPAIALKTSCDIKASDQGVSSSIGCDEIEEEDAKFKSVDYGAIIGVGVAFNVGGRALSVGARYDHSFADIDEASGISHRVISIVATFEFPWMK